MLRFLNNKQFILIQSFINYDDIDSIMMSNFRILWDVKADTGVHLKDVVITRVQNFVDDARLGEWALDSCMRSLERVEAVDCCCW